MAPEFATVFSAIIAVTSVSINLYGGLITEKRRAELAREVERERQLMASAEEERSVVARYRGPLLEATADLEQRLYHIATLSGEWRSGEVVCEEEVVYTLFTLAQWLGFLEVIRREGPRERSFLIRKPGNGTGTGYSAGAAGSRPGLGSISGLFGSGFTGFGPAASGAAAAAAAAAPEGGFDGSGGADTLTTLVEGFRFVLSAHPATLQKWYEQGPERDHPGRRSRVSMLRGTAALRNIEQREAEYGNTVHGSAGGGGGGSWPSPPSQQVPGPSWAPASVAAIGRRSQAPVTSMGDVGGGGDGTWYGSDVGTTLPYGMPPPPTMPVVLGGGGGAAVGPPGAPADGRSGPGRAELVIGSLDECDLAAAGLGMSDPTAELAAELAAAQSAVAASAASATASSSGQLPTTPLTSAQAAAIIAGSGSSLSSFSSLSSVGSLSSYDEASWNAAGAGNSGDENGSGGARRRARAPRDVFHVSRGSQRSIGSLMVITPMGASRHYTLSYGDFYNRYYLDEFFAGWLRPVHTDILALVGGRKWSGQGPFPINRWTRLLLLQQLLVEAIDVLDPAYVRVPADRRVVLAPVECQRAPELEAYKARMRELSTLDSPLALQQQLLAGQGGPLEPVRAWWAARVAETAANAEAAATGGSPGALSGQVGSGADDEPRAHRQ